MNDSTTARKLREQIGRFSGVISSGLPKTARRFVYQMLYGVQAEQSIVLAQIARSLQERASVKKTEERLSRQLQREGLGEVVQENVLKAGAAQVKKDTLIIVDPTDIQKKYAKKMPCLGEVRDGDTGEIGPGYMLCQVIGTELGSKKIVPLWSRLYSAQAPGYTSENDEILDAVFSIHAACAGRGIYVMDSGGDRNKVLLPMLDRKMRFLFRLKGDRHLVCGSEKKTALELARQCRCPYTELVARTGSGKHTVQEISFGYRRVKHPLRDTPLFLLVVKGFGQDPLMVLTTEPLRRSRTVLLRAVKRYLMRWSIEETIRFIKQCYGLENVRLLTYRSLHNLMPIVLAVTYFAAAVLDVRLRLAVMAGELLSASKRIFGIPDFRLYALSDGLRRLFARHPGRLTPPHTATNTQLYFEGLHP